MTVLDFCSAHRPFSTPQYSSAFERIKLYCFCVDTILKCDWSVCRLQQITVFFFKKQYTNKNCSVTTASGLSDLQLMSSLKPAVAMLRANSKAAHL